MPNSRYIFERYPQPRSWNTSCLQFQRRASRQKRNPPKLLRDGSLRVVTFRRARASLARPQEAKPPKGQAQTPSLVSVGFDLDPDSARPFRRRPSFPGFRATRRMAPFKLTLNSGSSVLLFSELYSSTS